MPTRSGTWAIDVYPIFTCSSDRQTRTNGRMTRECYLDFNAFWVVRQWNSRLSIIRASNRVKVSPPSWPHEHKSCGFKSSGSGSWASCWSFCAVYQKRDVVFVLRVYIVCQSESSSGLMNMTYVWSCLGEMGLSVCVLLRFELVLSGTRSDFTFRQHRDLEYVSIFDQIVTRPHDLIDSNSTCSDRHDLDSRSHTRRFVHFVRNEILFSFYVYT